MMKKALSLIFFPVLVCFAATCAADHPEKADAEKAKTGCPASACVKELPEIPKSISEAQWLWCGTPEKPSEKAYFRYDFTIDSPVKRAWFYTFLQNGGDVWINGHKLNLKLWEPVASYRGHVKGSGAELAQYLKTGRNVLAVAQKRINQRQGFILRGQIEYKDGRITPFCSSAKYFKTAPDAPENWKEADFDDSQWGAPWSQGDARSEPWSSYGDTTRIYCTPEEYQRYCELLAPGFDEKKFLAEPEIPQVKIVYKGTTPAVEVNGKLYQPVVAPAGLNPKPTTDSFLKAAAKAGVPFVILSFSDDQAITYQKDGYDFSQLDNTVRRILMLHPDAYLIVGYTCHHPNRYWMKNHPDELVGFAKSYGDKKIHSFWDRDPAPSFASKAYRAEIARVMKLFAEHCNKQPWGRRIVAVRTGYGPSNDGMPWGCNCMPDTGKRMTEAFRRYLKEKYQTDAALQKAWADPSVTLETALVPDEPQRYGSGCYLRDPADPRDRKLIDYYTCYHREFADYMIAYGKAVKEAFPGRLAGGWWGYTILAYPPEAVTSNVERVLKSPYIDFLWATTCDYNLTDGLHRHLHSLFRRYGKLSSIEADIRTHVGEKTAEKQWLCKSPEETRSTVRKVIGNSFFNGSGYHLIDFGARKHRYYFDCPEAMESIAAGGKIFRQILEKPLKRTSDIAVIQDPNQMWLQGRPLIGLARPLRMLLSNEQIQPLNFSGYSHDLMTLEDYLESDHPYKTVVFLDLFQITPEQKAKLLEKLRRPGITAIWNFAPGLITPQGFSDEAMTQLTGIKLCHRTGEFKFEAAHKSGARMRPTMAGKNWSEKLRVYSADPDAEVLANFIDDRQPAMVRKKLPDGSTAIFCSIPITSAKLWSDVLKDTGCHAFTKNGFFVRRNSRMLQVFSGKDLRIPPEGKSFLTGEIDQSGEVTVTLEKEAKRITDLFTGEEIARDTAQFTLKADQPHTWLLQIDER